MCKSRLKSLGRSILIRSFGLLLFIPASVLHADPSSLEHSLQKAESMRLAESRAWRKLLFIPDLWYGTNKSIIDDPQAFLARKGQRDPKAEMVASIEALFDPKQDHKDAFRCRFPARSKFLIESLEFDEAKLAPTHCEDLTKFLKFTDYEGVSLVFSNYYVDNPSSMFGHTFLRLRRNSDEDKNQALLDDVLDFSAHLGNSAEWITPLKGLTGFYPGKFSILPYYHKIEEYNNLESRDLWEYKLKFSEEEIRRFELILWELGPIFIDYYFLDDNCSFIMLALFEAVRPEAVLTPGFKLYAVPADTLRAVMRVPDLLEDVEYRPSSLSRFRRHYEGLSERERSRLKDVVKDPQEIKSDWTDCDKLCKARVIDASLEFIDFKEKLGGAREPEKFGKLRSSLLSARAKTGVRGESQIPTTAYSSRPDLGHSANAVGLSLGANDQPFASLRWRPALHEFSENSLGYSNGMGLTFLESIWQYEARDQVLLLKNLHALEITSAPEQLPLLTTIGWHLDLGYDRSFGYTAEDRGRVYLQGGLGPAGHFFSKHLLLYSRVEANIGASEQGFVGPSFTIGAVQKLGLGFKLKLQSDFARYYFPHETIDSVKHNLILSYNYSPSIDFRLNAGKEQLQDELSLSIYLHF